MKEWFKNLGWFGNIAELFSFIVIAVVAVAIILWIERRIFSKHLKSETKIQARFIENALRIIIILIAIFWVMMSYDGTASVGKIFFQGTAIIGAIIGLAAQPVISDLICGFMLSASRPFEIGDRVELDDGTAGIVTDITLRHVVIHVIDTLDVIIPNSKLNSMSITNMSHNTKIRSVHFRFNIAYTSDVDKAMEVIRKAVEESKYSVPGHPTSNGNDYGPVYFIAYADSSLIMATTVYYEPTVPTEVLKNDINLRVNHALKENGIEIPYTYINIVQKQ